MANRGDIARLAGVSTATVTNVLNNSKPVSRESRRRVLEAAKELQYPVAPSRTRTSSLYRDIVFVVEDALNPHQGDIFAGMNEIAREIHAVVSLLCPSVEPDEFCRMLISRGTDAVFFSTSTYGMQARHYELLQENRIIAAHSWDDFLLDFDGAMSKALMYLKDMGHRRVMYLSGLPLQGDNNIRFQAFLRAVRACGLEEDPRLWAEGIYPYETSAINGYWVMKNQLENHVHATAVLALNDLMAMGAMRAIKEHGLRIPDDISVIGCDDIPVAECTSPALTTLRIPARQIGRRIMMNILQRMQGKTVKPLHMPVELINRKSTSRARTAGIAAVGESAFSDAVGPEQSAGT